MLHLFIGLPGSGKTEHLLDTLTISVETTQSVLIVPDQLSFERERELLRRCSASSVSNYEVLSFNRLGNRVFREYGGLNYQRLEDTGKLSKMIKAISLVSDQLNVLKRAANSTSFSEKMLSFVSEHKRNSLLSDTDFLSKLENCPNRLTQKYIEIRLIIGAYEALSDDNYIDEEDELDRLHDKLMEHHFFKDKEVYIDGFKDFTAQQIAIIEQMLITANNVYFTFTCDNLHKTNEISAFDIVRLNINRIIALAQKHNISVAKPIIMDKLYRYKNGQLAAVAQHFHNGAVTEKISNEVNAIEITACANRYEEVQCLTRNIKRNIMAGMRYSELSVIAMDIEPYKILLDQELSKLNIPYYIDSPDTFANTQCYNVVKSLLYLALYGLKSQYLLYLIKMLPQYSGDTYDLERFVTVFGIEKNNWNQSFLQDKHLARFSNKEVQRFESIRVDITTVLDKFTKQFKGSGIKEKCAAIYTALKALNYDGATETIAEQHVKNGDLLAAKRTTMQWSTLIDILDQFVISINEHHISDQQYIEIFCRSAQQCAVAKSPSRFDEISIGSARLIRPACPKAVFLLGCALGEFPSEGSGFDLLSIFERKMLLENGIPVNDSLELKQLDDRYVVYTTLCLPSEQLYITYPESNFSGDEIKPSNTINQLISTFKLLKIGRFSAAENIFNICNLYAAFSTSHRLQSAENATYKAALEELGDDYADKVFKTADRTSFTISKGLATALSSSKSVSPTRIESFYKCQFYHFCRYMLGVKPLELAEIDVRDRGKIIHFVLEKFFALCIDKDEIIFSQDEISIAIEQWFLVYINENLLVADDDSKRFLYQLNIYKSLCLKLILDLIAEINQSKFVVKYCELSISSDKDSCSYKVDLPSGENVNITGFIDRVDTYVKDSVTYVKIVDYKTGTKKFMLSDTIFGQNLQMIIYLFALRASAKHAFGSEVIPAGIVYVPTKIEKQITNENITDEVKFAKRTGLILDDTEIISAMQSDGASYIPVNINKGGEFGKHSSVISLVELDALEEKIKQLIVSMQTEIRSGNILVNPLDSEDSACKYCDYMSVCLNEDNHLNVSLPKQTDDVVKSKLLEGNHV